jgi:hypothetical protein
MGAERSAQAGPLFPIRTVTTAIGVVAAAGSLDVALPADAAFAADIPVDVGFAAAPGDPSLGIAGAWVSDPTTGVVTVRFVGLPGPTAAVAAQKLNVSARPR